MEEMKEPYYVELNDEDGWVVLGPNDYREVAGKGKESMEKAFAEARRLNDGEEGDGRLS